MTLGPAGPRRHLPDRPLRPALVLAVQLHGCAVSVVVPGPSSPGTTLTAGSLLCRYHSITLIKFMGLITDFFGGKARMLAALAGQRVSPDPFPCCCCCCLPLVAVSR